MALSTPLESFIAKLRAGRSLCVDEASTAAKCMAAADVDAEEKMAFLIAMAQKGETAEEVAGFADTFRGLARDPGTAQYAEQAIDIVGTGGDKSGSFNISSATAFYLAAAGVPVLKHGNRSITSQCGSAQLIEAVGVDLEACNDILLRSIEQLNFTFFYAPAFHPAFKTIMPVRQTLAKSGQRTIFNILGPLINPGLPAYQLLGVFSRDWVKPYASAAHNLGLKRGLVVHCVLSETEGMDELSSAGTNMVEGFGDLDGFSAQWRAEDFGLQPCLQAALKGGDVDANLAILHRLADGEVQGGLPSSIMMNVAAALWIVERADSMEEGIQQARAIMAGSQLKDWLHQVRAFYG